MYKVEKHIIKHNHPMYKVCDDYCWKSKNLYNYANYVIRQSFIKKGEYINYYQMATNIKDSDDFKSIGSNSGQMTLKILDRSWKSYFAGLKSFKKDPSKFLGKPKMPKYLDTKKGRFVWILTNLQTKIINGYLKFSFKPLNAFNGLIRTKVKGKHKETRIVPKGRNYVLEIVYQIEEKPQQEFNNRIVGIDLGIDNLATIQNNFEECPIVINGRPIKSINHYYNKKKSKIQNKLSCYKQPYISKNLYKLNFKREQKIDHYMHKATRWIVNYCKTFDVTTVVVGKNDRWKQNVGMGKKNNQKFVSIPFEKFIFQLEYKLIEQGITLVKTEESYTSKASFLDRDEMKKGEFSGIRIKRGLYQSSKILINADVNGASNIIRKVFPNAFDGIKGVGLHPSIVNLV